ncbi:MAG: nucleotide exchange factor GrpE [Desulfotomaculaceae bacterium]|nr:nucleotide exchange factor GrpE [Desulfotomaculaceae bacterium]
MSEENQEIKGNQEMKEEQTIKEHLETNHETKQNEPGKGTIEETDPDVLRSQFAEQQKLAEDYFNRLARVQADYDNFRRRTRKEKADFYKYASEPLVVALLPVLDNFERALAAEGESVESFKSGVQMIFRQLMDILEAEGLTPVLAVGEQFDPTRHEAVLQAQTDEYPDNTIIEEFSRGYCLKDKVIRPSMVKVARSS